jgi:hypothetical protein
MGNPTALPAEKFYIKSPIAGNSLAGYYAFATFQGDDFDKAPNIYLYRVVNDSIASTQTACSVKKLQINNGYNIRETLYEYDRNTATCDPFGKVSQYARVKLYPGGLQGGVGYTEQFFFNGLNPSVNGTDYPIPDQYNNVLNYFSLFNGQLFKSQVFDTFGKCVQATTQYPYAFIRDINTSTPLLGDYIRMLKKVDSLLLSAFDIDKGLISVLDDGVLTNELQSIFASHGFELPVGMKIVTLRSGLLWTLQAPIVNYRFTISLEGSELKVYSELDYEETYQFNEKGQIQESETINYNSEGKKERNRKLISYAWEKYPAIKECNLLSSVAEERSMNDDTITGIGVTTYQLNWPGGISGWTAHKSFFWNGEPGTDKFDFQKWSGSTNPPADWIKVSEIQRLSSKGYPLEIVNMKDQVRSILMDKNNRVRVAEISNASMANGEADYYGFEPYENSGGWNIYPGSKPVTDFISSGDAFTGTQKLEIPAGKANKVSLHNIYKPKNGAQTFVLSCWVKIIATTDDTSNFCGWEINVKGSGGTKAFTKKIEAEDNQWSFCYFLIDPLTTGVGAFEEIELFASNERDNGSLLLDNIRFYPFQAVGKATIYNTRDWSSRESISLYNNCKRFVYDQFQRLILVTNSAERPVKLGASWLWRQNAEIFNKSTPNSIIEIKPQQGGRYENFHHGEEWRKNWDSSAGWEINNMQLQFSGTGKGELKGIYSKEWSDYGLRIQTVPSNQINKPIGIVIKNTATVQWNNKAWELLDASGSILTSSPSECMNVSDWLLVISEHRICFWGNGELLLQHIFTQKIEGQPIFFCSDAISIKSISRFYAPMVNLAYSDNEAIPRQALAMDDANILVCEYVQDKIGRQVIETKKAPFHNTDLGYRNNFISSLDWVTGKMKGEIRIIRIPEPVTMILHSIK